MNMQNIFQPTISNFGKNRQIGQIEYLKIQKKKNHLKSRSNHLLQKYVLGVLNLFKRLKQMIILLVTQINMFLILLEKQTKIQNSKQFFQLEKHIMIFLKTTNLKKLKSLQNIKIVNLMFCLLNQIITILKKISRKSGPKQRIKTEIIDM